MPMNHLKSNLKGRINEPSGLELNYPTTELQTPPETFLEQTEVRSAGACVSPRKRLTIPNCVSLDVGQQKFELISDDFHQMKEKM